MSGEKKNGFGKMFSGLLLILLIVGLAGFGATNFGGSVQSIGTVGEEEIDVNDYYRALQSAMRAQEAETGESLSFLQAQIIGLPAQVRSQMLANAALDNKVREMGLSVGDEEVSRQILQYPAFQGLDGEFDREAYRFTLERAGLNEAAFEESIRKETARGLLQAAAIGGILASEQAVDTIYNYIGARRSYNLITLTADALDGEHPAPTEAELEAYYQDNAGAFTVPESRRITYVWLTPASVSETIDVDEAILKELYQERIDEFVQPERRLVERLVFPDQAAADAAAARLENGDATFEELVAERGLELSNVDLGDVEISDLGAAGSAVFGLTEPGVTGPHATDLGPALFRMNIILEKQETTFEEVRDELASESSQDQAIRIIADMMGDIDDRMAAGATLEDLASETEMELGEVLYNTTASDGIAAYAAFREAVVLMREGDFPELLELEDGGIFSARLDGIEPPRLLPLDEVREDVKASWEAAETTARLQELATSLKERLDTGENVISVGHPVELFEGLTRAGIAPAVIAEPVFTAEVGETAITTGDDAIYVIQLKDILPPDADDPSTTILRQIWSQQNQQALSQDLFSLFSQALLDDAGLSLNQTAIEAVHAQITQ